MGDSSAYDWILRRLQDAQADFSILEHQAVYTMADVERLISIPVEGSIKTMVLSLATAGSPNLAFCGISASGKLDFGKVARVLGVGRNRLGLLPPERVLELLGAPIGAIGLVWPGDHETLLSSRIRTTGRVYCGIGRNDRTLDVGLQDLIRVTGCKVCDIEKEQ